MRNVAQKIMLTGGAGFIGSHLAAALLATGHQVLVYDNLSVGREEKLPRDPRLQLVCADLRDASRLAATCARFRPDIILHLGALHYIPYCLAHPEETRQVNVGGTEALLAACAGLNLRKFLFVSTAAVYPNLSGALSEEMAPAPVEIYGTTKLEGERRVTGFYNRTRVPSVIVRLFNVYGDGETNPHLIPRVVAQLAHGNELELGNLTPARDYIFVDDVVGAFLRLAFSDDRGLEVFNVGTGTEHSVQEIVTASGQILQRSLSIKQSPKLTRENERQHLCADVSKIARLAGWRAGVNLAQGLRLLFEREGLLVTT